MGRPRQYDEQSLLDTAQELFWTRGYDRTSLEEVASASGVGTSSLYARYGNKLGLFLRVFGRYCAARVELASGGPAGPSADLEAAAAEYLDRVVADCLSHTDRRGCLMLNSIAELGDRFPEVLTVADAANDEMVSALAARLRETAAARDIVLSPADARRDAETTVLASQGIVQLSRLRVPPERLRDLAARSSRLLARSA
jgi:TetR/AcrR family transcriptional repressor of nem operon